RLARAFAEWDQQESEQCIDHEHVAAEEHRVDETDREQNCEPPREAAGEARALASGVVELYREAHAEQECEDGEELAEGEQLRQVVDRLVQSAELIEAGRRLRAGEKAERRVRDDDAEQGDRT